MVKLIAILCAILAFSAVWMIGFKVYKTQRFIQKRKKYLAPEKGASVTDSADEQDSGAREEPDVLVDAYEQQLFDDIAEIFMSSSRRHGIADAEQVQADVFRKMPVCSKTQIRKMDLEEWSIYWTFYDQSLEYYVGRYGVFYAHVDRFGAEHKQELRFTA